MHQNPDIKRGNIRRKSTQVLARECVDVDFSFLKKGKVKDARSRIELKESPRENPERESRTKSIFRSE